jgi:hypothetical protein
MSYNIYGFVYCMVIKLIRYMILSSHNEIWQSITFGKAMPIVQNMCFLICYNRHTSFCFFSLYSHFLLTYSHKPQRQHQYMEESANKQMFTTSKKRKEKKEKVYLRFFRHQPSYFFIRKIDSYWWLRNTHQLRKQNFSLTRSYFFLRFRFFIFSVIIKLYSKNIDRWQLYV